ncbi:3-oxoacyl-[acyl-carrier-protein] reductase [Weeksellaceae bacterium TAE3-ERU29]|nr:3-oxoacyl-[acyl-carrier-protein] reductase [Weeksellaceae bacterium TAE3-ERU29]
MELLKGKVAIVTGATRGIGKGILEKFVENGAKVAFTYASSANAAKELEEKYGENVKGFQSDASDFDAAQNLINEVLNLFGKIDILVNNAGITKDSLLMRMSFEDWQKVIQVNLDSAFNLTKAAMMPMMKQRKGSIINMSSVVGLQGNAGQTNYAASKAGLLGFTKSVALELGSRNIRCNAIAPGFIETEMTDKLSDEIKEQWINNIPLKRGGNPEDIANACLYLGSELSSYVTGQVLSVDGGMHT